MHRSASDQSSERECLKRAFAVALLLACLPPILAHTRFLISYYQANDDVVMSLYAAGAGITDRPSPCLAYIGYPFGQLLTALNGTIPGVNWYYAIGSGLHFLGTFSFLLVVLRRAFTATTLGSLAIYLLVFDLYFWVHPQFTITAFLLGQSAVLAFLNALGHLAREKYRALWGQFAWTAILLPLSYMYRDDSALLVLCLIGPLVGLIVLTSLSVQRAMWLSAYAAVICAMLVSLKVYHQRMLKSQEGWSEFQVYNSRRGYLTDYLPAVENETLETALQRVGWTHNDWRMLRNWFFYDQDRFSLQKLGVLTKALRAAHYGTNRDWRDVFKRLSGDEYRPLLLGLGALAALSLMGMGPTVRVMLVGATALTILIALSINLKLELRVIAPILGFCAAYMIHEGAQSIATGNVPQRGLTTACRKCLVTIGLMVAVGAVTRAWQVNTLRSQWLAQRHERYCRAIGQLAQDHPGDLIVDWGGAFDFELYPAAASLEPFKKLKVALLSTHTRTPFTRDRFLEYGITDPYKALYERDDITLLAWPHSPPILVGYVAEHYGVKIESLPLKNYGFFQTYHFRVVP